VEIGKPHRASGWLIAAAWGLHAQWLPLALVEFGFFHFVGLFLLPAAIALLFGPAVWTALCRRERWAWKYSVVSNLIALAFYLMLGWLTDGPRWAIWGAVATGLLHGLMHKGETEMTEVREGDHPRVWLSVAAVGQFWLSVWVGVQFLERSVLLAGSIMALAAGVSCFVAGGRRWAWRSSLILGPAMLVAPELESTLDATRLVLGLAMYAFVVLALIRGRQSVPSP